MSAPPPPVNIVDAETADQPVASDAAGQVSSPPPPASVQPALFAINVSLPLPPIAFSMIGVECDPDIVDEAADRGECARTQVDDLRA